MTSHSFARALESRLWPKPLRLQTLESSWVLPATAFHPTAVSSRLTATLARLHTCLEKRGARLARRDGTDTWLRLDLVPDWRPDVRERAELAQGYRLVLDASGAHIQAPSETGLHHGLNTLIRIIDLLEPVPEADTRIPGLAVDDAPHFAVRGVCLDISRCKVPTLATLESLIDLLASLDINHLQLYTEHTFAYRGHETVWRDASPLTPADVRHLAAYCQARFIELVPNQNSLGHFHRWLVHEPYRKLAEVPEGFEHPFSPTPEPFSLCPIDPASLTLLEDLYSQLLPLFPGTGFNAGLDETMDLGKGRSAEACAARGTTEVYLEFLNQVADRVRPYGKRLMFWSDIVIARPDLLARLPEDAIALEWGYEANHPFNEHTKTLLESGRVLYLCPGTSSWNSIGGRFTNARENLSRAARHGYEAGVPGYLITDWGDHGHWQPLPVSYPGLVIGAGLAWNSGADVTNDRGHWSHVLARLVPDLASREQARYLLELGDMYRLTGARTVNGSALFFLLHFAHGDLRHERLGGIDRQGLERARDALADLGQRDDTHVTNEDQTQAELRWVRELMWFAADFGLARFDAGETRPVGELPPARRRELRQRVRHASERFAELWPARFREGGLAESRRRFKRLIDLLGD